MTPNRGPSNFWLGGILIAGTLAAYWGVWRCEFVNFDDQQYVYENLHVKSGLSVANVRWAWTTIECANWHPLTWLSLMLDATLFGPGPTGFHAINLLWHVLNVLLLFGVLKQFTGSTLRSVCVSALFAVHPVHVESVAWISERKDVLSTFFGLLSLSTFGRFTRTQSGCWYATSLISFAASLLAKPMLVTLPCLLLVLDIWPLRRWRILSQASTEKSVSDTLVPLSLGRLILEKLPFFALTIVSSAVTFYVQRAGGAVNTHWSLSHRLANAVLAYGWYLKSLVLQAGFAVFYPHHESQPPWGAVATSAGLLIGLTVVAILLRRRAPFVATGWFWFVGMLVPVIGIVQVGTQQRADRYLYLPAVGIYLLVVWSGAAVIKRSESLRRPAMLLMALVVAVLTTKTLLQTRVWRNSVTLWSNSLRVSKGDARSHAQLAQSLQKAGQREQALHHYQAAFQLTPSAPHLNVNYGLFLLQDELYEAAIPHFQRALKSEPRDSRAMGFLGFAYWQRGELDQARTWLQHAIDQDPQWAQPYFWFGQICHEQKQHREAIEYLRRAVQADPVWQRPRQELDRLERSHHNAGVTSGPMDTEDL